MKTIVPLAALLVSLLPLQALAGSAAKTFATRAGQDLAAISGAPLDAATRQAYADRLDKLIAKTQCVVAADKTVDCSKAKDEEAQDALDDLKDIKTDLDKKILAQRQLQEKRQLFLQRAETLLSAIDRSGLPATDPAVKAFNAFLKKAKCEAQKTHLACPPAGADKLAELQDELASLQTSFASEQAAAQQAAAQKALKALASQVAQTAQGLQSTISGHALAGTPVAQQLQTILETAQCTSTSASVDCSGSTTALLNAASTALTALAPKVQSAASAAGTTAQSQTEYLFHQLNSEISNSQAPLTIKNSYLFKLGTAAGKYECTATMQEGRVSCIYCKDFAGAQAAMQKVADDFNAAYEQASAQQAQQQALLQSDVQTATSLMNQIHGTKNPYVISQYDPSLNSLLMNYGCGIQYPNPASCRFAQASSAGALQSALQQFASTLGTAIKQAP